jgi:uncharacterized membrane protein YfcA
MLFALLGAALVGLSLGLLGSGGSIFTVPILHYGLGQPEKVAVAGSLFVVGSISLLAAVPQARAGRVDWRMALAFGLPGVVGTWLGAALSRWVPGPVQLGLFAVVMLVAAVAMFRPAKARPSDARPRAAWKIGLDGLAVGGLTGLVGVGGGFMIVPALVLLGGLEMHAAVGTSLVIIAAKSFSGFAEYLNVLDELGLTLDWNVLLTFVALGAVGSFAGTQLGSRIPQAALRKAFSGVLAVMAAAILWAELGGSDASGDGPPAPGDETEADQASLDAARSVHPMTVATAAAQGIQNGDPR